MRSRRIWLLRIVAASVLAGDIGLALGLRQFSVEPWSWQTWLCLPFLLTVVNGPYFVVALASALLFRRQSASLWLLAAGVTFVGSASLFLRWADYDIARQAWEARMSGHHFMCCAPPGRLVALILDYVGVGLVSGLALLIFAAEVLVRFLVVKPALSRT